MIACSIENVRLHNDALDWYYKMDDGTRIQVVGIVEDGKIQSDIPKSYGRRCSRRTSSRLCQNFRIGGRSGYCRCASRLTDIPSKA